MKAHDNGRAAMGVSRGRRIVVTGGAGFLGRVVVGKLREHGCTDVTVPRRATCDLSRWDHIEQLFDKCRPHLLLRIHRRRRISARGRDAGEIGWQMDAGPRRVTTSPAEVLLAHLSRHRV